MNMQSDSHHGLPAGGHEVTGHEESDASIGPIVLTGAGLAVVVAIVCGLVYGIFWYLADHPLISPRPNPMAETNQQQFPPAPRLEEHPAIDMRELRSEEDKILSTYGWTDKDKGIVRVPIDLAMELQLERGFPTAASGKPSGGKK
jgi:hypothetical protein